MQIDRELIAIEQRLWRAAGDRDDYARRLAPDAVHVFPGRGVVDREQVLTAVAEAEPWQTCSIGEPRIVLGQ